MEEPQRGVEGRAAPALYSVVTHLIHLLNDWQHFLRGHSGCNQGLVRVTEHRLHNFYRFLFCFSHFYPPISNSWLWRYTPKIAIKHPAATAVPMTPATFGPMACISRKLVGSASAPTFWDTLAAIGTADTPADPISGLIFP